MESKCHAHLTERHNGRHKTRRGKRGGSKTWKRRMRKKNDLIIENRWLYQVFAVSGLLERIRCYLRYEDNVSMKCMHRRVHRTCMLFHFDNGVHIYQVISGGQEFIRPVSVAVQCNDAVTFSFRIVDLQVPAVGNKMIVFGVQIHSVAKGINYDMTVNHEGKLYHNNDPLHQRLSSKHSLKNDDLISFQVHSYDSIGQIIIQLNQNEPMLMGKSRLLRNSGVSGNVVRVFALCYAYEEGKKDFSMPHFARFVCFN